jgi:hypothetical protein
MLIHKLSKRLFQFHQMLLLTASQFIRAISTIKFPITHCLFANALSIWACCLMQFAGCGWTSRLWFGCKNEKEIAFTYNITGCFERSTIYLRACHTSRKFCKWFVCNSRRIRRVHKEQHFHYKFWTIIYQLSVHRLLLIWAKQEIRFIILITH